MAASKLADYLLENPLYAIGRQNYMQGSSTAPVQSPLEGLARALQGATGGFFQGQAIQEAKGEQHSDQQALAKAMELYASDPVAARSILAQRPNLSDTASALLMNDVGYQRQIDLLKAKDKLEQDAQGRDAQLFGIGGGGGTQTAGGGDAASRIGGMESGNNYQAVGPVANAQGHRAWGKYQVLEPNIGPWTQEVTGRAWTPQEFIADTPEAKAAQDAVFKTKFGQYAQKYGQEGAARAWFAGEGGMNNPNAADVNGMTVAKYGQKFAQGGTPAQDVADGLPQMPAQGSTPQVAPGQPQAPQQAANVPNGDTINFQGVELPKAAIASALMIRDAKERQGKITDIVRDAVKKAGGPDAGTAAGDVHILDHALKDGSFASDPRYVAAFNRASEPKMSQQGQLQYPDMSAYPRPILPQGQPTNSGQPRFEDTPASRFQMSGKLADDFNQLKPVKDYREVEPIMTSMRDAATRNNRVADLNLVYGLAKIMDPTSVVREGEQVMVRNAQSLPQWLQGMISAANGGSAFPPEQRTRILQEAESRVSAYKQQYDAIEKQFVERGQRFGLKREDIVTTPATGQQAPAEQGGARPVYDVNGNRIK